MTEREKMLAGMLYIPRDEELNVLRRKCAALTYKFNNLPKDTPEQKDILRELLGSFGKSIILCPIQFDYGCNTYVGDNSFVNFGFTVLDCAKVSIGDSVLIGPNVSLLTPVHPIHPDDRRAQQAPDGSMYKVESAKPITIEDDVWIGGGVTVCGGVTIGKGSIIGAGSVVVKDIPPMVVAAGNPCKVIRPITDEDRLSKE